MSKNNILKRIKKEIIAIITAFSVITVTPYKNDVWTQIKAVGELDLLTVFRDLTGYSGNGYEAWADGLAHVKYSYYAGSYIRNSCSGSVKSWVKDTSASAIGEYGLDCTTSVVYLVSKAMVNAGYDPDDYFADAVKYFNTTADAYPPKLTTHFTNMTNIGLITDYSQLSTGDIIVYGSDGQNGHLAVYYGNGYMMEMGSAKGLMLNEFRTTSPPSDGGSDIYALTAIYRPTLDKTVTVSVEKSSSLPDVTGDSIIYSLAGAVFDIYTTDSNAGHDSSTYLGTLITDSSGNASADYDVRNDINTLYVFEISAPTNYTIDSTSAKVVDVTSGSGSAVFSDTPIQKQIEISLIKTSSLPDVTDGNGMYSLAGAEFEVYSDSGLKSLLGTLTTDSSGKASATYTVPLYINEIYVVEKTAPTNYTIDSTSAKVVDVTSGSGSAVFSDTPIQKQIEISLIKTSSLPDVTDGNGMYSLAGAEFEVYSDSGLKSLLGTLTTDSSGKASATYTVPLYVNKVYVVEKTAPYNYTISSSSAYPLTLSNDSGTATFVDSPINDPESIKITKIDSEGKTNIASLAGSQFTIKYYDTHGDVTALSPTRTWVIETAWDNDANAYVAYLNNASIITKLSDSLYYNEQDAPILPLGTITIEETKAADKYTTDGGYFATVNNGEEITGSTEGLITLQITNENSIGVISVGNEYTKEEDSIRGSFRIQKLDSSLSVSEVRSQGDATFAGAKFALYYMGSTGGAGMKLHYDSSTTIGNGAYVYEGTDKYGLPSIVTNSDGSYKTDDSAEYEEGDFIEVITLDESGYYTPTWSDGSTNSDYLGYGDYKLVEVEAPKGYSIYDSKTGEPVTVEFSITKDDTVISLTASDNVYQGRIQITKTKVVPLTSSTTSYEVEYEKGAVYDIVLKKYVQEVADKNGHSEITVDDVKEAYELASSWSGKDNSNHNVTGYTSMEYDQITTGSDGVATSELLAYGDYVFAQVATSDANYQMTTSVGTFTISDSNPEVNSKSLEYIQKTVSKYYVNGMIEYLLKIYKQDADTGELVTYTSSAFKIHMLKDAAGNDVSTKTDTDTSAQTRLVNGYVTQSTSDGYFTDIFMTASDSDESRESGVFYGSTNSDEMGLVTAPVKIPAGTYQLEEVGTSDGFATSEPYEFTIDANENPVEVSDDGQYVFAVIFENNRLYGDVAFNKSVISWKEYDGTDVDTTFVDYDVTKFGFTLYAEEDIIDPDDGSVLVKKGDKAVSLTGKASSPYKTTSEVFPDKNGDFSFAKLPLGTYRLVETTIPDGYVTAVSDYIVKITQEYYDKTISGSGSSRTITLLSDYTEDDYVKMRSENTKSKTYVKVTVTEVSSSGNVGKETEYTTSSSAYEIVNNTTKLTVSKKTVTGDKELEGATLQIIDAETGKVVDEWVSTSEEHTVEGLTANKKYILRETLAPTGYAIATDITFTVDDDGKVHGQTMIDKFVSVIKSDTGNKTLEGTVLQVLDSFGNVIDEWTTTDEAHIIAGLVEGNIYTLHEVSTPNNEYALAEDITFEVTGADEEGIKIDQYITMVNKYVTVFKSDIDSSALKGAWLQVLDENGEIVDEWISGYEYEVNEDGILVIVYDEEGNPIETDDIHMVKYLAEGNTYTLHEVETVAGYYFSEDILFEVTGADEECIKVDQYITMVDNMIRYKIAKVDDFGEYVEGVTLELYDVTDAEEVQIELPNEGITTKEPFELDGKLEAEHHYKLIESEYVGGVYKATSIEFTVPKYGTDSIATITMEDVRTAVSIAKVDNYGEYVKNAVMSIYLGVENEEGTISPATDEDGNELEAVYTWTTTDGMEDISAYVKGTNELAEQWYILREEEAPFGFEPIEDTPFKVTGTQDEHQVIMAIDRRKTFYVSVVKVDAQDETKRLKGAEISLFTADGNIAYDIDGDECVSVTDDTGVISWEVEYNGDSSGYYFMEINPPEGYQLSLDNYVIEIRPDYGFAEDEPISIIIADKPETTEIDTGDPHNILKNALIGLTSLSFALGIQFLRLLLS